MLVLSGLVIVLGGLELWYFVHNANASNRANLSVHSTLPRLFTAGQPLTLVATIKNVGDTEARDVSVSSALVTGYYNSDADALKKAPLLFSGQPDTRLIVSSGESFKKNLASRTPLAPEEYANLMNGKMKAYFFSEMTYSDVMGALHQGHICEYFDPSESAMVPCPAQNSSN
jgi:hypothetical protein